MANFSINVDPAEVGLDAQRLRRIDTHFRQYVDDGRLPGWQVMVSRCGKVAHLSSYGLADKEAGRPVQPDTIWRIYSMTKPITSVAAMMLWEQGAFELSDPVSRWLPEFEQPRVYVGGSALKPTTVPATEPIRVWHLLPLLLLLLLVAGCASPGHELHRGTPVAPPPAPPVRPGHGAPVMGQPGQQGARVPWSPHQRPLPPTQEPGLWAGDGPQASRKREPAPPELFGVLLPGLRVSEKQVEEGPARACVALWNHALPGTGLAEKVNALRPAEKRCMVSHMFNACVKVIEELDEIVSEKGVVVLQARKHRAALRKTANDFFRVECGGARLTDSQQRLLGDLQNALHGSLHSPE